ncbi:hypothetical protein S40288_10741 [Stachybotrys chartarum IBT 40288]|nr:hypothetical protein S40288_10741 [Stachybotrys chartarum IBT 40288]
MRPQHLELWPRPKCPVHRRVRLCAPDAAPPRSCATGTSHRESSGSTGSPQHHDLACLPTYPKHIERAVATKKKTLLIFATENLVQPIETDVTNPFETKVIETPGQADRDMDNTTDRCAVAKAFPVARRVVPAVRGSASSQVAACCTGLWLELIDAPIVTVLLT